MAHFPPRPSNALSGSQFLDSIADLPAGAERDAAWLNEILRGNFPESLRRLVPITISKGDKTIIYKVMPNFLSVGNDSDSEIVPLGAPSAQQVATSFGCVLPTREIVDQIYQNAKVKLPAAPLSGRTTNIGGKAYDPKSFVGSKHMISTEGIRAHNDVIRNQLTERQDYQPGDLVAGQKKDVVISNALSGQYAGKLGLYGLYDNNGKPIQSGEVTPHEYSSHVEYGMAVRLIDREATLNGEAVDLVNDIMKDKDNAFLVSNSGPLQNTSYTTKPQSNEPQEESSGFSNPAQVPPGYKLLEGTISPGIKTKAAELLRKLQGKTRGTYELFDLDGKKYMGRLERHYHPPGYKGPGPIGEHDGITVYQYQGGSSQESLPSIEDLEKIEEQLAAKRINYLEKLGIRKPMSGELKFLMRINDKLRSY